MLDILGEGGARFCQHDMGWFQYSDMYREKAGLWACEAGCGTVLTEKPQMSDIADKANDTADLLLSVALHKQQQSVPVETPKGIGFCLHCATDIDGDGRWCDADCRDGWEQERDRKARA